MQELTYDLNDLTGFIRRVFALNLPDPVWVRAELAQANLSRGNYWLTLVQKDPDGDQVVAQIDAVLWSGGARKLQRRYGVRLLRDLLQPGLSVRLRVTATFHVRYGLRLVVEDLDPSFTIGELEQRRRAVLDSLRAAEHLGRNARLPLPPAIQRIAVISSDTAAGLADFDRQLAGNPYGYEIKSQLLTAAMQGVNTSGEIRARLRQISRRTAAYDAVVIIRGGGSRMDLSAFDDEELAVAVATHPLPVLVGIGHETDHSVLDEVAHTSLKTPTAAAVFLLDRLVHLERHILHVASKIGQATRNQLLSEFPRLDQYERSVVRAARTSLANERRRLDYAADQRQRATSTALRTATNQLNALDNLLTALSPATTLARGYALVSQSGRVITDAAELAPGEIELTFHRGAKTLRVEE